MWLGALLGNQFRGPLAAGFQTLRREAEVVADAGFGVLVAGQHVMTDPYVLVDPMVALATVKVDLSRAGRASPAVVASVVAGAWGQEQLRQAAGSLAAIGPGPVGVALAAGYMADDFPSSATFVARYRIRRDHLAGLTGPAPAGATGRPLVWLCANTARAAELAARFGVPAYVGPRVGFDDIRRMREIIGAASGAMVIRRDILLLSGPGLDLDPDQMAGFARTKYQALDAMGDVAGRLPSSVADGEGPLLSGAPEQVFEEILALRSTLDPAGLVLRLSWPDMGRELAIRHCRAFCGALAPALRRLAGEDRLGSAGLGTTGREVAG